MKRVFVCIGLLWISSPVAQAQEQKPPPPADSAAVAAIERVERQKALDSLAAGRRRWERAGVVEYRLEAHHSCFCVPEPHRREHHRNLLLIRNGRVVRRDVGKTVQYGGPFGVWWTVDSLFSVIDADLQDSERKVRRLELSPQYGFPMRYDAGRTEYEDTWIEIVVDSFAVIRTAGRKGRRANAPAPIDVQPSPRPTPEQFAERQRADDDRLRNDWAASASCSRPCSRRTTTRGARGSSRHQRSSRSTPG